MKTTIEFCPSCQEYPVEARLLGVLARLGCHLRVDLAGEGEAQGGAFAIYLNETLLFSTEGDLKVPAPGPDWEGEPPSGRQTPEFSRGRETTRCAGLVPDIQSKENV